MIPALLLLLACEPVPIDEPICLDEPETYGCVHVPYWQCDQSVAEPRLDYCLTDSGCGWYFWGGADDRVYLSTDEMPASCWRD